MRGRPSGHPIRDLYSDGGCKLSTRPHTVMSGCLEIRACVQHGLYPVIYHKARRVRIFQNRLPRLAIIFLFKMFDVV